MSKETIVCIKCGKRLPLDSFYKSTAYKSGRLHTCKECAKEYARSRKAEIKTYYRNYYNDNKDKIRETRKMYYKNNKSIVDERSMEWGRENRERKNEIQRRSYAKHSDRLRAASRDRYAKEPWKAKEYRRKNKDRINARNRHRCKTDPQIRIKNNIRSRMSMVLEGRTKAGPTMDLLGCTLEELKIHLENKFQEGMCWGNYGRNGWHIDHIRPCASFDMTDFEQQKQCFHYTNLQPLWERDNIIKRDKWDGDS